ncbi:MAG: hypothetical protein H6726_18495 [Sandaracinaceae bacterium]|nr:hypothetical protein [Sandaracinaceae bacterium]
MRPSSLPSLRFRCVHAACVLTFTLCALLPLAGCEADECALDWTVWLGPNPNCPPGTDNSYGACSAPRLLFEGCAVQLQVADTIRSFTYRVVGQTVELTSSGTAPVSAASLGADDTLSYERREYTLTMSDPDEYWFGERP